MNKILVLGAGRSATALINYLLDEACKNSWFVTVADSNLEAAQQKVNDHSCGRAIWLNVTNVEDRKAVIAKTDLVISLLPPFLHTLVAEDCLLLGKHLLTASYVSQGFYSKADEVREKALIFMGELGLDPGLDHMSAMQKINEIREGGGKLTAFRSFTGGLVAPESDDNPWHYKISWNPRNVVLAGQGTAQYIKDGKYKFVPYHRLFSQAVPIDIQGMGTYEVYANRDSLLYRSSYGLDDIPQLIRGTIRYPGYSRAWNALIKIGYTNADFPIMNSEDLTYYQLTEAFLGNNNRASTLKECIADLINEDVDSDVMHKLEWLGIFSRKKINLKDATPAKILEELLLKKWKLKKNDKDMVIMQHEFEYTQNGKNYLLTSTLVMKGEDSQHTAMSKLVGLPLGITAKMVMAGKLTTPGVNIPVLKEVYTLVLDELEKMGIVFQDSLVEI
ncbi:MAG TPA: saccharopine dehydrogenase [Saprospiraceae bacterium]|nr:saccharopine dehydrogenase [Saprospiraceae bacterium]